MVGKVVVVALVVPLAVFNTTFSSQEVSTVKLAINSKHEVLIQRRMGGFLAAISCPQRIHSFCALVDCVIAQLKSPQDKLFKAEHFSCCGQTAAGSYLRTAGPCGTPQRGSVGETPWSLFLCKVSRQQLAPGE